MICRPEGNGWLLIAQGAHAWMAGELAACWGNEAFAVPEPYDAVVLATRLHDIGWAAGDAAPPLDDAGQPVDFLNISLAETIPIWRQAVKQIALLNPYSALLVSMHATTIYRRRLQRGADPPADSALIQSQLEEQAAIQAMLAAKLADHPRYGPATAAARLSRTYRWLRVCDLLSLAVLATMLPPAGMIAEVPGKGDGLTTLQYRIEEPYTLLLDPSPFAQPRFQLHVDARYLDQRAFPDQVSYQAALAAAAWRPLTVTVQA
jgi:hypothetical protein